MMFKKCLVISDVLLIGIYYVGAKLPADSAKPSNITEIKISRDSDPGSPCYVITFFSDDTIAYEGKHDMARIGKFKGKLRREWDANTFPILAEQFEAMRVKGVSTGKPTNDQIPIVIRVVKDGKPMEIMDLCPGLDHQLWSYEMMLRGVAYQTHL